MGWKNGVYIKWKGAMSNRVLKMNTSAHNLFASPTKNNLYK